MNAYLVMTQMMTQTKMTSKSKEQRSFLFQKNQEIVLCAIDMNHQGFGVAKVDGFVVFVKSLIIHEVALVKLVKVFKNYAYGIILELFESSEHRVQPVCSVYHQCGGCDLMHISADFQKEIKRSIIIEQFNRHKLTPDIVNPTLAMKEPFQYRNKVSLPITITDGNVKIGFYRQHSHDIIEFDTCHVQSELQNKIISYLKQILNQFPLPSLKHIILRESYKSKNIMVGFVVSQLHEPHLKTIVAQLTKQFSNIKSVMLNLNKEETNTIFGKQDEVLFGESIILDESLGLTFKISLRSFYQVNSQMMNVLYKEALRLADIQPHETILDLYCGIGTIALLASQHAKKVYGVELNPQAIVDANENALLNNINNIEFICGDVKDIIDTFSSDQSLIDTIIVDPPRSGLHDHVIEVLKKSMVSKIVYVSCNPLTLATDCKKLSEVYDIESVQPVDMFGQTKHIESLIVLKYKYT